MQFQINHHAIIQLDIYSFQECSPSVSALVVAVVAAAATTRELVGWYFMSNER